MTYELALGRPRDSSGLVELVGGFLASYFWPIPLLLNRGLSWKARLAGSGIIAGVLFVAGWCWRVDAWPVFGWITLTYTCLYILVLLVFWGVGALIESSS